jgi:NitT/TauT family transport system substrate-binding protein
VDEGKIRVLFAGDDVKSQANLTGRVIVAKADYLQKKRDVVKKFLTVLDKCIDWAYANKAESSKMYGALNKVDPKIAKEGIAFYKRNTLAFGPIKGVKEVMQQAVDSKFLTKPLTDAELKELIDIVYTSKK